MIILNGNWKEEIIKAFEDGEALRGIFQKPKGTEVYRRHFFLEKNMGNEYGSIRFPKRSSSCNRFE